MAGKSTIPQFWFRWLYAVVIGVMLFGVFMFLTPDVAKAFFSTLFYADATLIDTHFGAEGIRYIELMHGVTGAVILGWAVALFLVLKGPFRRGEREAWLIFAISLAIWYVPDTIISLSSGFWQNALLNLVFAVLFAIPLAATYQYFPKKK